MSQQMYAYPLERTVIHNAAQKVCHGIDELGRTFCGAARVRPRHSLKSCREANHPRCETCDSLRDLWRVDKEIS